MSRSPMIYNLVTILTSVGAVLPMSSSNATLYTYQSSASNPIDVVGLADTISITLDTPYALAPNANYAIDFYGLGGSLITWSA